MFLSLRHVMSRDEIIKKTIKNAFKILSKINNQFNNLFHRFRYDFLTILDPFWPPKLLQNLSKTDLKIDKKYDSILN